MLQNLKQRQQQEGFTIIEVMIVLVIAAVILLIVFLAVPALQRNSRNTQIKNEAAQLLSATAEFTSNNNGVAPVSSTSATGFTGATDADKVGALTKNKNITILTVVGPAALGGVGAVPTAATITGTPNKAYAMISGKCSGASPATAVSGTTRQVALLYAAETGASGAVTVACTESGL